jgi:isocitrate dehydrogenase
MYFLRVSSMIRAAAFVALLNFAGDIVADSIADARGNHCISQSSHSDSQHEKTPCSHCSCAVHVGAVVITNSAVRVSRDFQGSVFILTGDESAPPPLPTAIDHSPQLA